MLTEPSLMGALSRAIGQLAACDEPQSALDGVLAQLERDLAPALAIAREEGRIELTWKDDRSDEEREQFATAVTGLVDLAAHTGGRGNDRILDTGGFMAALERISSGARWRGARMAIAVFEIDGLVLGPGTDESLLIDTVGRAARSCVRSDDVVGHLGANQFALLFPRAGTFEARAAYRRVRDAVMQIEWGQGLVCGAAGFAELEPGQTGSELLASGRARLQATRTKNAYLWPGGGSPITPLAS